MTLLDRLEGFYDAVPRDRAREETFGGLSLFVREGAGYPFYARPRMGAGDPASDDLLAVLARQRELRVPEALEWVHDTTPGLLEIAEGAGMQVLQAPLLVFDRWPNGTAETELLAAERRVRVLDPATPSFAEDIAACVAIARAGFGEPGTAVGRAGPAELKVMPLTDGEIAVRTRRALAGLSVTVIAESIVEGPLASGQYQRVDDVAEIVGVATLPAARRRGLGAAVTAALAHHALDHGVRLVFLSAGSDDVARIYASVGFGRVATACIATAPE